MNRLSLLAFVAAGCCLVGCKKESKEPIQMVVRPVQQEANASPVPEKYVGKKAIDPVCGSQVEVTAQSPYSQYQGQMVFFCCSGCKKQFDADPKSFADKTKNARSQ